MIEIIIWLIFFPLATTINRYFLDRNKKDRNEEVTSKEVKDKLDFLEFIVFIGVLIYLIKR
jgi:hypothetical protein